MDQDWSRHGAGKTAWPQSITCGKTVLGDSDLTFRTATGELVKGGKRLHIVGCDGWGSNLRVRGVKRRFVNHCCLVESTRRRAVSLCCMVTKVTLQEASEYVDHDILTSRFHVTHYAGCAILYNKDTFYSDINVQSIYLHDTRRDLPDQVMEGEQGWVMQGVLLRASFRRSPVSGQKYFTVLSLHISNIYAKKKGIAKKLILTLRAIMISQEVDLVAGDFNGTAWRCRSKDNLGTIDEAFTDRVLPTPPGPTPLWGPGSIPDNWADVCGFLKLPGSTAFGKCMSMTHSPFHGKRLVFVPPIKVAITKHGFIWTSSIGTTGGPSTTTVIGTFPLKNDLQITHTGLHKDVLAKS